MYIKLTISPSAGFKHPVFGYDTIIYCKTSEGVNIKRSGIYRTSKNGTVRIWPIEPPLSEFDTVRVWPANRTVLKKLNGKPLLEFTNKTGKITYTSPKDNICDILLSSIYTDIIYVKKGQRLYFP